jgi:hypothetical protein
MKQLVISGLMIAFAWLSVDCFATENDIESKIKAGYLYNFTKFVKWPPITSQTFNLCILGNDPFGPIINSIENKSALNRSIKLLRIGENELVRSLNLGLSCHILYISGLYNPLLMNEVASNTLKRDACLVVGESEQFVAQGGMVGFVSREGKIKLHINLLSARRAGIQISAKLLEVAEHIKDASHD